MADQRAAARPACYAFGPPFPKAPFSFDQGASCGNARKVEDWSRLIAASPGCEGCTRAARGLDIAAGQVEPHPPIDSRTGEARQTQGARP